MSDTDRSPDGASPPASGSSKLISSSRSPRTEVPERHVVDERAERGLDRRLQPGDPGVEVAQVDPAPRQLGFDPAPELRFRLGTAAKSVALQHLVDERADVHAAGHVGQRQRDVAQRLLRPVAASGRRTRLPTTASSSSTSSSGSLPTRASWVPAVIPL